jgi:hypothetical protein
LCRLHSMNHFGFLPAVCMQCSRYSRAPRPPRWPDPTLSLGHQRLHDWLATYRAIAVVTSLAASSTSDSCTPQLSVVIVAPSGSNGSVLAPTTTTGMAMSCARGGHARAHAATLKQHVKNRSAPIGHYFPILATGW